MSLSLRISRVLTLLRGLMVLSMSYAGGWLIRDVSETPVPAGIYGLLILFVGLLVFGGVPMSVRLASEFLIKHMPLFFLPAAVSLIGYRSVLQAQGFGLILALTVSTLLALGISASLMQWLSKGSDNSRKPDNPPNSMSHHD